MMFKIMIKMMICDGDLYMMMMMMMMRMIMMMMLMMKNMMMGTMGTMMMTGRRLVKVDLGQVADGGGEEGVRNGLR